MIQSFFILNSSGEILVEKHCRGIVTRTMVDVLLNELARQQSPEEVNPIIATPTHYLIHIFRNGLFLLAIVQLEVAPLLVLEFLSRLVDIFTEYFDDVDELIVKDNFIMIYQLLDEMMDSGFPLITEPNILKDMIPPPSLSSKIKNVFSSESAVKSALPTGTLSNIPWRRSDVKYLKNEISFDFVEYVDQIIDRGGQVLNTSVTGEILCACRLSGMPDLTLSLLHHATIEDFSFHPCVRYNKFLRDRVVSFIPPDGNFRLMTYKVPKLTTQLPIFVTANVHFPPDADGQVNITVGQKRDFGKKIDKVRALIRFPHGISSTVLRVTAGSFKFDEMTKVCAWDIGTLPGERSALLEGSVSLPSNSPPPDSRTAVLLEFRIADSVTDVRVANLDVARETYSVSKGYKRITKAGNFEVRT